MMRHSDTEQAEGPDRQYTDTLSPPLFLTLTILIGRDWTAFGHREDRARDGDREDAPRVGAEPAQRRVAPLQPLRADGRDHRVAEARPHAGPMTLRGPFYSQCYLTAPFRW